MVPKEISMQRALNILRVWLPLAVVYEGHPPSWAFSSQSLSWVVELVTTSPTQRKSKTSNRRNKSPAKALYILTGKYNLAISLWLDVRRGMSL
jgi:hypothetical protein